MKQLLPPANATFSASGGTITFATTIPATISHILHVTNITRGVLYFQPQGGLALSGTYASPVLTLNADTSTHADGDKLEIFYDDGLTTTGVTGGLTDTELRATPVPVSGTVTATTGGLTDTQLRATPVPVSGTVTATTGGLTDTQLRATPVPVSGTVTATTGGLTDTQLRATPVPVSGTVTATTGGLTDTQLRATPVPVSGTVTASGTVAATQSGTWTVQPGNTANTTAWKVDASSVAVPVTDNSGSLTVDNGGTFAVQAAATLAAETTKVIGTVNVAAGQTIAVTNAGTFAVQAACTNAGTFAVQVSTAVGAANTANGQVSISSAATIITSRALRRYVIIRNLDTAISGYVGIATVTTANGMLVKAQESIRIDSQALIQGIAASGTITFAYIEFYD